jgi:hypothetical protein
MNGIKRYCIWIILACVTLPQLPLRGQDLTNQTNIYIGQDLEIYFDGNIANEGFLQQQGIFSFTGHWTNTGAYQGNGTLAAVGSNLQTITNNRQTVAGFRADGAGDKRILGLMPIARSFELLSGKVFTTSTDTLLLQQNAVVSGGSETSYVDGPLFSAGTGYKFFPVGKNEHYNPVELSDITGINPVLSLEVFQNVPTLQVPPRVTYFSDIYWKRSQVSGTFTGTPVTIHYDLPDRYTDSHVVEILQGSALNEPFTNLDDVSVAFQDGLDDVMTQDLLTGKLFLIGSSIPIGGVEGEFYFSTSLSPRASNEENSAIKVFGNKLIDEDFLFKVYNRWGLLVFESSSLQDMIDKGWDGTRQNGGDHVPAGVYPYLFKARTKTGAVLEKKGVITVVY